MPWSVSVWGPSGRTGFKWTLTLVSLLLWLQKSGVSALLATDPKTRRLDEQERRRIAYRIQKHVPQLLKHYALTSQTKFSIIGTEPAAFAPRGNLTAVLDQQEEIFREINRRYPTAIRGPSVSKLANVLYIRIPDLADYEDFWLSDIGSIRSVQPHVAFEMDLNDTIQTVQADVAHQRYCATGRGIKVAIIDSGVDYTHAALGGAGTQQAYESAYGTRRSSPRNRRRDGLFPTTRVPIGYDYRGDESAANEDEADYAGDNDPIDGNGHGTYAASCVLAVAPDAQIMAVKVCATDKLLCSESAILQGLEYAVDNGVDIISLSLGIRSVPAYYSPLTEAVETAFATGVLVVASSGNSGNLPFVIGAFANSPNILTVGATGHKTRPNFGRMETYSSRGPGDLQQLKPDLSAPSGSFAAAAGTGDQYRRVFGTSFSCPIVAGAAAVLKEKCGNDPVCSPLFLKAVLMNNAFREIMVSDANSSVKAPLSWVGAGEVRVQDALEAEIWAYSPDDGNVQPSLSLGIINAARNQIITRRLRIKSMRGSANVLDFEVEWRDPDDLDSRAVSILFDPPQARISGCNGEIDVTVTFVISASAAPDNYLTTNRDADALDKNEFDGHIIITSRQSGKAIGVPFHMLLRRASSVSLSQSAFAPPSRDSVRYSTMLRNDGAGVAQVDAFQLLYVSEDDPEGTFGSGQEKPDIRSLGYRLIPLNRPSCTNMLEFAINLWERPRHIIPTFVAIVFESGGRERSLLLSASHDYLASESYVVAPNGRVRCTGFSADHGVSSSNIIVRACNEHLDLSSQGTAEVSIMTYSWTGGQSEGTGRLTISFPESVYSASSIDIQSGQTQEAIVSFKNVTEASSNYGLGILFATNSFRRQDSTGSATKETETVFFSDVRVNIPKERTPDTLDFPQAKSFQGPRCQWLQGACDNLPPSPAPQAVPDTPKLTDFPTTKPLAAIPDPTRAPSESPTCPPAEVPRLSVPTSKPTVAPSPILGCFDGASIVVTKHRGLVEMRDLRLGEPVLVMGGRYESVYGFGEYDPSSEGTFLKIHTSLNHMHVTRTHLVFVKSGKKFAFIPASQIRVGDELVTSEGSAAIVESFEHVASTGVFAPFTVSGTIIVNGFVASSYVSLDGSSGIKCFGIEISHQWLAHSFEFPHRLVCHHLGACREEKYINGISQWVNGPFQCAKWILERPMLIRNLATIVFVVVVTIFSVAEASLSNVGGILFLSFVAIRALAMITTIKPKNKIPA